MIVKRASTRTATAPRRRPAPSAVVVWLAVACLGLAGCGSGGRDAASSSHTATSAGSTALSAAALINQGIAEANTKQYQQAETTFRDVLVLAPRTSLRGTTSASLPRCRTRRLTLLSTTRGRFQSIPSTPQRCTTRRFCSSVRISVRRWRSTSRSPQSIRTATAYLREGFVYQRLGDKSRAKQARARAVALDSSLATVTSPAR